MKETSLNETLGLNASSSLDAYGTIWFCESQSDQQRTTYSANSPIDWTCNGNATQTGASTDINKDGIRTTLGSIPSQWLSLLMANPSRSGVPTGSTIGPFGTPDGQPDILAQEVPSTAVEEPPAETLLRIERQTREALQRLEPTKPRNMTANVGQEGVFLNWESPSVAQIDGEPLIRYAVYRGEADKPHLPFQLLGFTETSSFEDISAVKGKSYVYGVSIVTRNNRGAWAKTAPVQIP
ncbi:hypothetical protein [Gloeobacter morelensis]|uniref:Fibronectin type-III domain-containing protein n=1 Tax=Gloeobacter morelensis MG652769 TaxID=2781736 RepID=A0ABY3PLS9_9CYAN|nr:hypothetical protein [Gloeobacter morelensis]UFP94342.1 hypothetical protein ISF26_21775 [Gloeobacter morelensis MG652769]